MTTVLHGIAAAVAAAVVLHGLIRRWHWTQPLHFAPNSTVLITGASSGIGLEMAKIFAASQCCVILAGRDTSRLEDAAEECRKAGAAEVTTVSADFSTEAGTTRIVREFKQRYRQLNYLVLNAGQGAIAPFDNSIEYTDMCRRMMEVNYFANVRLLQALLPLLDCSSLQSGATTNGHSPTAVIRPRILVISSLAGIFPSVLRSAYTASKHALQGFSNALRQELNVATLTIACPGFVDTEFHRRVMLSAGGEPSHQRPGAMTAADCARDCLRAMREGASELVMTRSGRLGYALRPWVPEIVDRIAKRKALSSVK